MSTKTKSKSIVQSNEERKKNAVRALKIKNKKNLEQKRNSILRERIIYESSPLYIEEQRQNQIQIERQRQKQLQNYYEKQLASSSQMQ